MEYKPRPSCPFCYGSTGLVISQHWQQLYCEDCNLWISKKSDGSQRPDRPLVDSPTTYRRQATKKG